MINNQEKDRMSKKLSKHGYWLNFSEKDNNVTWFVGRRKGSASTPFASFNSLEDVEKFVDDIAGINYKNQHFLSRRRI
ncbi:MAG: hypothetical protein RR420_01335 [Anaerovoracaceae bacterium]